MKRWIVGFAVGTISLLYLSGCLVSEAVVRLSYDAAKDEFRQIVIYQHLRASAQGPRQIGPDGKPKAYDWDKEFAEVESMVENRAQLVVLEPSGARLWGMLAKATRTPDGKLDGGWEPIDGEPAVAWNDIRIRPGELFKDSDGYLGYYHEMTVPGSVVDQLLKVSVFQAAQNGEFKSGMERELARREAGGPRYDWKKLTAKVTADLQRRSGEGGVAPPENTEEDDEDITRYLEVTSLLAIQKTVADGMLDLRRRGALVYLRLPLSADDSKNVTALGAEIRNALLTVDNADSPDVAELKRQLRDAGDNALAITQPEEGGIEITVDLPIVANAISEAIRISASESFKSTPKAQEMATAMAERATKELKVKPGVTSVEQLLSDFNQSGR